MKKLKWVTVALLFYALISVAPGHSFAAFEFTDVSPNNDYYEQVHYIADLGIINKAEKFNPGNNLTRAQAAKMLVIASKKQNIDGTAITFADLKRGTEQYDYASKAVSLGYFSVDAKNHFNPNEKLKRDEMGYALAVAFNLSEEISIDKPLLLTDMKNHKYAKQINGLYYGGITQGDAGKFLPNDYLTRKQFALFVARGLSDRFSLPVKLPEQTSRTFFAKVTTGGTPLNVRSLPAITGDIIQKLDDGDIVEVVGQNGDWLLILLDGNEGFINKQYTVEVNLDTENPSDDITPEIPGDNEPPTEDITPEVPGDTDNETEMPETTIPTSKLSGKVTAKTLNVREQASSTSPIIGSLKIGQVVDVLSLEGNWAKVHFNSQTGYVSKSFLKLINREGNPLKNRIIVLDAGHGAHDPGASSKGLTEKSITLKVAKLVEAKLKNAGAIVKMTRSNDTFLSLEQRTNFAKSQNAETFVSIHVNSATSNSAKGTEVFYDSSLNQNASESKTLANLIQKNIIKDANMANRGVKDNRFYVIRNNNVAAVLVELGFISNADDFKKLSSDAFLEIYAEAIYKGLVQYYSTN